MTYEEIVVTPEIAGEWLKRNTKNARTVKRHKVAQYAKTMRDGYWKNNGEAIVFDEDGYLKNGQHRLCAIVESGVTCKMLVVRGVDRNITTWDDVTPRTIVDKARLEEVNLQASTLAGAGIALFGFGRPINVKDEIVEYGKRNYDCLRKAELICGRGINHSALMKRAPCMAAVYCALTLEMLKDDAMEAFCRIVNSGMPVEGYIAESALALRNTLMAGIKKEDGTLVTSNGSVVRKPMFEITWKAIMCFREGRKLRNRIAPDGSGEKVLKMVADAIAAREKIA